MNWFVIEMMQFAVFVLGKTDLCY